MISTIVIISQLNGAILYDIAEQIGLIIIPVELEIGLPVGLNGLYLWPEINLSECGLNTRQIKNTMGLTRSSSHKEGFVNDYHCRKENKKSE